MKNARVTSVLALGALFIAGGARAALNLEGQSGVFLNSLAYPLQSGKIEVSTHNVNLDRLGGVSTFNVSTGLNHGIELGVTKVTSSVSGVKDQNVLLAKWQFSKETQSSPAVSLWAINRDLSGGSGSLDYGISTTKLVHVGKYPTVVDLGVRSTKALGLGLFGFSGDRKLKFEGSAAVFVTKKFAVGTEFKQQIGADTWKDIAFRYVASDHLNIDAGIADLGPGLGNQIALAATWSR